jgi:hypothetical protein
MLITIALLIVTFFVALVYAATHTRCLGWVEVKEYNGLVGWVTGSKRLGRLASRERLECYDKVIDWPW